jgi:hypothetical protein
MKKIKIACGLLAALFVVGIADRASAQRPSHFYPARPTFSAYLLYKQFNATGIPNYYTFVRPEVNFRDYVRRTERFPASQRQPVSNIEEQVGRALESQLRQRTSTGIGTPAVPARYGDTSHFFPTTTRPRR